MNKLIKIAGRLYEAALASAKTKEGKQRLEEMQFHYAGYFEPGYDKDCPVVITGNWNEAQRHIPGKGYQDVDDITKRLGNAFDRFHIQTEWSDEWAACYNCDKLVRTEPDSYCWKPSYVIHKSDFLCKKCYEEEFSIEDE